MDKKNSISDKADKSREDGLNAGKKLWRERSQPRKGFPQNANDKKGKDRLSKRYQRASHAHEASKL
jgi:hypothetical protein